jgi:hypothetical protein
MAVRKPRRAAARTRRDRIFDVAAVGESRRRGGKITLCNFKFGTGLSLSKFLTRSRLQPPGIFYFLFFGQILWYRNLGGFFPPKKREKLVESAIYSFLNPRISFFLVKNMTKVVDFFFSNSLFLWNLITKFMHFLIVNFVFFQEGKFGKNTFFI